MRCPLQDSGRSTQRRGSNAIEFALTLPFFLLLIMGLVDYGFLFAMQAILDDATALSCRAGSAIDPELGSPTGVANTEWATRSLVGGLCAATNCTFDIQDLTTPPYEVPNRTLRCEGTRTMQSLTGFVPYPGTIQSVSYYRFEWQRIPVPTP